MRGPTASATPRRWPTSRSRAKAGHSSRSTATAAGIQKQSDLRDQARPWLADMEACRCCPRARQGGRMCAQTRGGRSRPSAPASPPSPSTEPQAGRLVLSGLRGGLTCIMAQRPEKARARDRPRGTSAADHHAQFVVGEHDVVQLAQARNLCIATSNRANRPPSSVNARVRACSSMTERTVRSARLQASRCASGCRADRPKSRSLQDKRSIAETCSKSRDQTISFEAAVGVPSPIRRRSSSPSRPARRARPAASRPEASADFL